MASKLSRDQKRKKKLAKRAHHAESQSLQPYAGTKYRTDKYAPFFLETETGIYEAYVVTGRKLIDSQVQQSIRYLIRRLRGEQVALPEGHFHAVLDDGSKEDLVTHQIQEHWKFYVKTHPQLPKESMIGVLRTLLHSISLWTYRGGYLPYVERFLNKMGVRCKVEPANRPLGEKSEEEKNTAVAQEPFILSED